MKDSGKMDKCMEEENLFGMMAHIMMVIMSMVRNKAKVNLCLLPKTTMKAFGLMENKKELVFCSTKMVQN